MSQDMVVDIRSKVRESYGRIAESQKESCCAPGIDGCACVNPDSAQDLEKVVQLYRTEDIQDLPTEVTNLSLGCGDPVSLAELKPGQTVIDLGSGGGIDCFLAAKQVGETGHVIGVDMTPQMIEKARENLVRVGAKNVEFRLGEIEHMPVADSSADVIISNCVINLSPDKAQVFREAYRVLRPGGKFAVSDVVTDGPLPEALRKDLDAWAGCVGGALDVNEYMDALKAAGFSEVAYTRPFSEDPMSPSVQAFSEGGVIPLESARKSLNEVVFSARITAVKK